MSVQSALGPTAWDCGCGSVPRLYPGHDWRLEVWSPIVSTLDFDVSSSDPDFEMKDDVREKAAAEK